VHENIRRRLFAWCLLAIVGYPCQTVAQDALPAPVGIDASLIPVGVPGTEESEDAPLPSSEPRPLAVGSAVSEIFSHPLGLVRGSEIEAVVRVDSRVTYDDNLFINERNKRSDLIFAFSPTIAVGIGDVRSEFRRLGLSTFSPAVIDEAYDPGSFIFARYTPTLSLFLDHDEEDALDHDAALEAQWRQAYLTLISETRFQTLSDPDIDVGGRVRRTIFSQDLMASYDYSERTSFQFRLRGTLRHYPAQIDSQELLMQNSVNYRLGARTLVGLGLVLGWLHAEDSGDQPYEQLLLRGRYHLSDKIDFFGNAGVEFRQLEHRDDRVEPVFEFGASYKPWEASSITLVAGRRIESSAGSPGFDVISTEVAVDVQQRFAGRYYLGLLARYQAAQYLSVFSDSKTRRDDIVLLQPYVKVDLSKASAIELGYTFQNDDSNVDRFTFTQNRVFLQFDALF